MTTTISELAARVYGPAKGPEVTRSIDELIRRWGSSIPARPPVGANEGFRNNEAILITYADQVHETGVPPLRSLAEFCRTRLRGLISGIHILPFYPWTSDDGFSVKNYYAVDPDYGSWADIGELGRDFALMFDAVLNHMSSQSGWFQSFLAEEPGFGNFFVTVEGEPCLSQVIRPRALPLLTTFEAKSGERRVWTTFSADQVDLNYSEPEVLLRMLDVLLFYVSKGAAYIRLDAIAFLWKQIGTCCLHLPQTHAIVQLFRAVLARIAPDVRLITETNVPHVDNISYFGDGTNEAQLVYNFALPPLVLHSFLAQDATRLTHWAKSLVLPSDKVTFFNFLASHDGIGVNPARGILAEAEIESLIQHTREMGGLVSDKFLPDGSRTAYELNINYFDALGGVESEELHIRRFLTAQAIMLAIQGVPGIYFHSLFGSRGDKAGAVSSGIHRRINREKLCRTAIEAELDDPIGRRSRVLEGYSTLLRKRRSHMAFSPSSPQTTLELDPRVFAVLREHQPTNDRILCLHNVSASEVRLPKSKYLPKPLVLPPCATEWLPI